MLEAAETKLQSRENPQDHALASLVDSTLTMALVRTGRLPPAQQRLRAMISSEPLKFAHQTTAVICYIEACRSLGRHGDIFALVGHAGGRLGRLFLKPEAKMPSVLGLHGLRTTIIHAYGEFSNSLAWLESLREDPENARILHGNILVRALLEKPGRESLGEALRVYQSLEPAQVALDITSSLWSALDFAERMDEAHRVYVQYRRASKLFSHVAASRALRMYTSRGWKREVEVLLQEISERGWSLHPSDKRNIIHCYASLGDVDRTLQLVRRYFPSALSAPEAPTPPRSLPALDVLNLILLAHVNAGRIDDAIPYLSTIMSSPTKPDLSTYNTIMKAFAVSGDVEGAVGVYDELLDSGLFPDVITFTTLIGLFANIRDPENARNMFAMMAEANVQPDEVAWAALINAHVESGQWQEVSELWTKLPSAFKFNDSVINTMLKAFVLLGAPLQSIERLFRRVQALRTPDVRAWAMVIQAACDNLDMTLARSLYEELDDAACHEDSVLSVNAYIYSILIAGYTRAGDGDSAKAVYEEMQRRGIAPTSVTYAMLIASLTRQNTANTMQQARDFATALLERIGVDNLGETTRSRGRPLENVLGPLLIGAGRDYDTASAKSYFDRIASVHRPSIPVYTMLLDAYRKAGEINSMLQTWIDLFQAALEPSAQRKVFKQRGWTHRPELAKKNALAIPLSIMIDGLSAAGRHVDVPRVWQQVKSAGFGFDAHNYNHLAVALARSGDVEGAFRIVDRVLIPRLETVENRRTASLRMREEEDEPQAEKEREADDVVLEAEETHTDPAFRPPNRRHHDRQDRRDYRDEDEAAGPAIDINLLRRWRPSDLTWRPSLLTIAVLDQAYAQLESPRRVWGAVGGDGEEGEGESELPGVGGHLAEHGREGLIQEGKPVDKQTAWATLAKINRRYGKAVALVMLHRRKRSARAN